MPIRVAFVEMAKSMSLFLATREHAPDPASPGRGRATNLERVAGGRQKSEQGTACLSLVPSEKGTDRNTGLVAGDPLIERKHHGNPVIDRIVPVWPLGMINLP